MSGLTWKQVETFWNEGFVAPLPALGPAEARGPRDWVETFERDHPHDRWAFNLKANAWAILPSSPAGGSWRA